MKPMSKCWVSLCSRPSAAHIGICHRCWKGLHDGERDMISFAIHSPFWSKETVAPAVTGATGGALLQHLELVLAVEAVAGALSRRCQAGKWAPRGSRRAR